MNVTVELVRPLVVLSVLLVACSGSNASVGPERTGPNGSSPGEDSSSTSPAPSADPGLGVVPPPGGDAGARPDASTPLEVHELEDPACHDLPQRAPLVTTTPKADGPPSSPAPLTTPPSGLYVATEIVEHYVGTGSLPVDPPSRTTIFVTPKRWYYLTESSGEKDVVTASWRLSEGWLLRDVVCRAAGIGQSFDQRAWPSPNGFTVQGYSRNGRPLTVRYERQ
jgi:hypothetical protein